MSERWLWHGGGLRAARERFGDSGEPWLDLSTGINPHCWRAAELEEIDWRRLPDEGDLRELEAAAAAHFGADPELVCALPGTEIGLRLIADFLPGPARHLAPSYRTHAEMFGGALPVSMITEGQGTLILANPNNPDGKVIDPADLVLREGWLVVDEAFADCDPARSVASHVGDGGRLVVFRSFGKFFGLAGLRLGFVIAPRDILAGLRTRLGAWPVSAAAIAIGTRAYRDLGWIAAMRLQLTREAAALDRMLARHGLDAMGACPLFRLVDTPAAAAVFERLAGKSILTRPFDYSPCWLRIGLPGGSDAMARLDHALRDG